jgi:hypothetical protein
MTRPDARPTAPRDKDAAADRRARRWLRRLLRHGESAAGHTPSGAGGTETPDSLSGGAAAGGRRTPGGN